MKPEETLQDLFGEAPYRMLVEEIEDFAIFHLDTEGRIASWNAGAERLFGYAEGEVVGQAFSLIFTFDDRAKDVPARELKKARETGRAEDARWHLRRDGSRFYANGITTALRDEAGTLRGFAKVARDDTKRKQAEEALLMHSRVLKNMVEGVSLSDENGIIQYTNPAEDLIFGYERGEMIGQHVTIQNTYPPEENARIVAEVIEQLKTKGAWFGEFSNRKKDGTPFTTYARVTALEVGDKKYWVCVQEDITARKQNEEALREARDELERRVEQRTAELSAAVQVLQTEIAERERAEEALQKGQEFLNALLETIEDGIVACGADGTITLFNRATREFHSLPDEPLPPDEWAERYDLYNADGRTPMKREDIPLFRAWQGEQVRNAEMVIAPKGGEARTLLASGRALFDAQGKKLGAVVSMHDITAQRRAEEERIGHIREQARRAEAEAAQRRAAFLAEASSVLASSLDYATTLKSVAHLAVPHLADWCVVDMLEQDGALHRLAVAHSDSSKEDLAHDLARRFPYNMEGSHPIVRALQTGNSQFAGLISDEMIAAAYPAAEQLRIVRELGFKSFMIVPLVARGRALGVASFVAAESGRRYTEDDLAFAEDLARRAAAAVDNAQLYRLAQRERAEAEQANRLKDEFLATLSHELRTPMTAILGWANLQRSGNLNTEDSAHALETIERNARAQVRLIDDLLDTSRIMTGKLRLDVRSLALASVIEQAVDAAQPAADAKNIRLQMLLDPKAGPVSGDPDRLQQVVWNLVSNAIKFTPKNGRVQVRLERINSHVEITVSDTGKGIEPEFLLRVFDRFRQADQTTTREFGGLGLGLAIVRQLVELHGGTVEAASAGAGQGTAFTVKLPVTILRHSDGASPDVIERRHPTIGDELSLPCPPELAGLRILVVDDDRDARELLVMLLGRCQAEVSVAASVGEALEAIEQARPDILVSDIGMPGEDGYTLIKKVRALSKDAGGDIPAIALTAYARVDDRMRALAAGFQMHVPKPIEPVELVMVIASLAGRVGRD